MDETPDRRNAGFALDRASIGEFCPQGDILHRRGKDPPPNAQEFASLLQRAEKPVLLQLTEGRQDEVSEAVARHLARSVEAEVEDRRHRRIAIRQSEETVSDVAWGRNRIFASETPGASPIVGGADDGREALSISFGHPCPPRREQQSLQPAKEDRQTRPAAERDDSRMPAGKPPG